MTMVNLAQPDVILINSNLRLRAYDEAGTKVLASKLDSNELPISVPLSFLGIRIQSLSI